MKLGIGLPNTFGPDLTRGFYLDWCRQADQAGFHVGGTIDHPAYDSWDPLASLAIAAGVTERIRLATTILQLPNRNEVLVAKQAAVIDRVSGGRLDLGIGVGRRESDYKAFGVRMSKRGKKIERQIRKIRRTWRAAKKASEETGVTGPAPLQKPLPPIWLGGSAEPVYERAASMADSFIFGTKGPDAMAQAIPGLRARLDERKAKKFQVAGLAYFAAGDDAADALDTATRTLTRYYGEPPADPESLVHAGSAESIAEATRRYEQAGLDVLILVPTIQDLKQLEIVAEHVLPAYRKPDLNR